MKPDVSLRGGLTGLFNRHRRLTLGESIRTL